MTGIKEAAAAGVLACGTWVRVGSGTRSKPINRADDEGHAMAPRPLIVAYVILALLPLALAWGGARPARSFWNEIASVAGMLAFAIILMEFVLSGRFRTVSRRIGIDVSMRFHQLLARSALVLAMVHPFLYRTGFNQSSSPSNVTGKLTLAPEPGALLTGVLLPTLVLLSISRDRLPWKYETWCRMHGLGALLIAAFVLHHTLKVGRYSQDPILAGLWLAMFAVTVLTLAYIHVLEPIQQLRQPWSVKSMCRSG